MLLLGFFLEVLFFLIVGAVVFLVMAALPGSACGASVPSACSG
jgi:hypothetical protein